MDVIRHPDNSITQSYGGIFFSMAALANLLPQDVTIQPVFGINKNDYEPLIERLKEYPNIDTDGIFKFAAPTNSVHLIYDGVDTRTEASRNIAEPIPYKRIKPYLDADMIFVNMISGFDLALDTLDELRMDVRDKKVPVYLDLHSTTLGVNPDNTRFRKSLDAWRRWLFWLHAVQMNNEEAAHLTQEGFDRPTLAKHVLALNTHAMLVTLGPDGYEVYEDHHKVIQMTRGEGILIKKAVDATGCGDTFGAAYCSHYMLTQDVVSSAAFANRAAAEKAGQAGSLSINELSKLRLEHSAPKTA